MRLWQLLGALGHVVARVTVMINGTQESFLSTKYSRSIGSFGDSECDLESVGVIFEEDACDPRLVTSELAGTVVFIEGVDEFDCFEEKLYSNFQRIGALALVNFDNLPPGSRINKFNLGHSPNEGNMPFLDLGNNFNPDFIASLDFTVNVIGCEEENPFEICYVPVSSFIDILMSMVNLACAAFTFSAMNEIKASEGTNPRRYILALNGAYFAIAFVRYFLGLGGFNAYFWPVGALPIGLAYIFHVFIVGVGYHFSIVSAAYWFFLRNQITPKLLKQGRATCCARSTESNFFKTREFHASNILLAFSLSFCAIVYAQPQPNVLLIGVVVSIYSNLSFILFCIVHYKFNKVVTEIRTLSENQKPSVWQLLTGRPLKKLIQRQSATPSTMLTTLRLQYHLGKWLQIALLANLFVILTILSFFNSLSIEDRSIDSPIVNKCLFMGATVGVNLSKTLLDLAFVQGIRGPTKSKNTGKVIPSIETKSGDDMGSL